MAEISALLEEVGVFDYSIFAYGDTLLGFVKSDRPWSEVADDLARSPIQERWANSMADLIDWQLYDMGNLCELDKVFRFDGRGTTA